MTTSQKHANRLFASLTAALLAAVGSTFCCIGPLIYLLFGISSTWLMGLNELAFLQIPLVILSLAAFGYGFWLLMFSGKIVCTRYLSRRSLMVLYWLAFAVILFFLTYPTVLPYVLEALE